MNPDDPGRTRLVVLCCVVLCCVVLCEAVELRAHNILKLFVCVF